MRRRLSALVLAAAMVIGMMVPASAAEEKSDTVSYADFTDLEDSSSWYYEGVNYAIENGIMNGTSGSTFSPDGTCTRSMIVTILYRLAGSPSVEGTSSFDDVEEDQWYTDAILWAEQKEITTGVSSTLFAVDGTLTREQFATFMYRFAEYMGYDTGSTVDLSVDFPDYEEVDDWAEEALSWAVAKELINGSVKDGETVLAPADSCTRSMAAVIIFRFMDVYEGSLTDVESEFSELFLQVAGSEALYQYVGEALDDLSYPEMTVFQDQLLIWDIWYSESEDGSITLILLDPETGAVTAEAEYTCLSILEPQVAGDSIYLCDSGTGLVLQLDENLDLVQQREFEPDYYAWYMGTDGETLYRVMYDDRELVAVSLETGDAEVLYSASVSLYSSMTGNDGVEISIVDGELQLSTEHWLDLADGTLSELPFSGSYSWVTCQDGVWLACSYGEDGAYTYCVGSNEDPLVIELEGRSLEQTEGGGLLLCEELDSGSYTLYDAVGSFVSACTPVWGDDGYLTSACTWSDAYQGYFLMGYTDEGGTLLFWDPSVEMEGEDLSTVSLSEAEQVTGGESLDASTLSFAEELMDCYGIELRMADQCGTEYESFQVELVTEDEAVSSALDLLAEALALYPDGFFQQLKFDDIRSVQFNLVGSITATDSNWGTENYTGFTEKDGDSYVIVLDVNQLEVGTICHEISHVIDQKLDWDSWCTNDALYSEDTWASFNPEGFEYIYVYSGWEELTFEGEEENCFVDTYSMISPTEDRARIMEYAMNGNDWIFDEYEVLNQKLAYYSECIRDTFNTEGWPEVTAWEEALN